MHYYDITTLVAHYSKLVQCLENVTTQRLKKTKGNLKTDPTGWFNNPWRRARISVPVWVLDVLKRGSDDLSHTCPTDWPDGWVGGLCVGVCVCVEAKDREGGGRKLDRILW